MRGPKRTKTGPEEDRATIAKLDRSGWSQRDIAALLRVTQQQVAYDLKKIQIGRAHV